VIIFGLVNNVIKVLDKRRFEKVKGAAELKEFKHNFDMLLWLISIYFFKVLI